MEFSNFLSHGKHPVKQAGCIDGWNEQIQERIYNISAWNELQIYPANISQRNTKLQVEEPGFSMQYASLTSNSTFAYLCTASFIQSTGVTTNCVLLPRVCIWMKNQGWNVCRDQTSKLVCTLHLYTNPRDQCHDKSLKYWNTAIKRNSIDLCITLHYNVWQQNPLFFWDVCTCYLYVFNFLFRMLNLTTGFFSFNFSETLILF